MFYEEATHVLAKSLVTIVADLTTTRVLPQPTVNPVIYSLHPCPLSLSFAAVCHFMQATPSAKGVACVTIRCCHQRYSDVCILHNSIVY